MSAREAIAWHKRQSKVIGEAAKLLAGQLSYTEQPERPQKTAKVDDDRTISKGKKSNFTTSHQVKNTLVQV